MCPLMFNQGSTLAEALPTFLAFIGFLPSVDSLVFKEIRTLFETLLTVITFIRSFFSELLQGLKEAWTMEIFLVVSRSVRFHYWKFHWIQTLFALAATFININGPLYCEVMLTKNKV